MTVAPNNIMLTVSALDFGYPGCPLFANFSATVPTGITLVCGGDGRGKSTLLRLLAGSLPAQAGQLQINAVKAHAQPTDYKAQVFLAQPRSDAFDQLTAHDYLQGQSSIYAGFDAVVLADMTHGLDLQGHLHKQLFMLSAGSRRKVFLAAAFASNAAVTLLDEPFAALDAQSISFLIDRLTRAAGDSSRAWVIADHVAPAGLPLVQVIDLGN